MMIRAADPMMLKRLVAIAALALPLSLGACETMYAQPPEGPAAATVRLVRDPDLGTFGTGQLLSWSSGADCSEVMKIAAFDPMSRIFAGVNDAEFRLPGGSGVFLLADIYGDARSGFQVVTACTNLVRFTPAAGGRYEMTQRFNGGRCETRVADAATGAPPPDFAMLPLPDSCIKTPPGYQQIGG